MKAALLMSHGFNDWNVMPEHSYRIYKRAKEMGIPAQIYYHQGSHGGPPPMKIMNRWFTKYLHGIENGVEKDPKSWIVRENEPYGEPVPYVDYPNPDATDVILYPNSGGTKIGELSNKKVVDKNTETLIDDYTFSGDSLAKLKSSTHRLLYVTPKFTDDIHISGVPKVTIKLASSKPAANLSVWLVSLPWNEEVSKSLKKRTVQITDNIITRGWADPQNHTSLTKSEPLKPGKFYTISFDLQPDDQIIKKGQQIGLMIFSSDNQFTLLPQSGTELTIDLSETSIVIPVVGGKKAFNTAIK
jgi:X-Pro dipeptidyl-peptidase